MDSETESTKSHTESEEDLGCYFLQPVSSPYNMAQRIHEANADLYDSNSHRNAQKTAKVKFREELISYEPDSTDDDINSIESDQAELSAEYRPTILDYKAVINNTDVNIFDIDEEGEEFEEEEVIEETESECDEGVKHVEQVYNPEIKEDDKKNIEIENNTTELSSKKYSKPKRTNNTNNPREIHCKDHCIDKLDFDLSQCIQQLEIHDKLHLPPLQLIQRKCCDKVKQKYQVNLPNYTGYRSEYGLSSRQLDRKEKQAETIRMREEMRSKLLEEYRRRKTQQNEKVFLQWLKEVTKRKSGHKNTNASIQRSGSPKRVCSATHNSTKTKKKMKDRPKTAEELRKRPCKNKSQRPRPHTTHSCVYIEVPQSLLEQGLNIGNLTITSSKLRKGKFHILAVS